jgi:hypothetical protein
MAPAGPKPQQDHCCEVVIDLAMPKNASWQGRQHVNASAQVNILKATSKETMKSWTGTCNIYVHVTFH